jgi:hypothetical protein
MATFKEMPQPRTFAPSKEDVLQNLQYFFGAPVSPEKLKDYSEHHATTCAPLPRIEASLVRTNATTHPAHADALPVRRPLPRRVRRPEHVVPALEPRSCPLPSPAFRPMLTPLPLPHSRKIRDTLNNLILKSPQNWQTSVGLPFFQIEGTVVEWGPLPLP